MERAKLVHRIGLEVQAIEQLVEDPLDQRRVVAEKRRAEIAKLVGELIDLVLQPR